jgi:hypothetical protein
MSDMGLEPDLEAPEPDAAEQHQEIVPTDQDTDDELPDLAEPTLEANEADAAEQAEIVAVDEDEYR